jgi:Domain of unknown function (DUF3291)
MSGFHLAQFNVARLIAPIEAAESAGFREALDEINALAEGSPGFVWRAIGAGFDSEIPATDVDPMLLANLSVWESAEALAAFAYRSAHGGFVKRGGAWFERSDLPQVVMWWIPAETLPTRDEAFARLERLRAEGPSEYAFDFKTRHPALSRLETLA